MKDISELDHKQIAAIHKAQRHAQYTASVREFNRSMIRFQQTAGVLGVDGYTLGTAYATLPGIMHEIGTELADNGFYITWSDYMLQGGEQLQVTCHVVHESGHSRSTTLQAAIEATETMSALHAIAYVKKHLQRYTLLGVLGLVTDDADRGQMFSRGTVAAKLISNDAWQNMLKTVAKHVSIGRYEKWRSFVQQKYGTDKNGTPMIPDDNTTVAYVMRLALDPTVEPAAVAPQPAEQKAPAPKKKRASKVKEEAKDDE